MDIPYRWIGQEGGTSTCSEEWDVQWMSHGGPHAWTSGFDVIVGQAWSVRVGCPMNVPCECPLDRLDNPKWTEDFDGKRGR